MRNRRVKSLIIAVICVIALVCLDQLTKYWAIVSLKENPPIELWPGVFELRYTVNHGAAFGLLQHQRGFFLFATAVVLIAVFYLYLKMPLEKKYRLLKMSAVLLAAGAVGNLIDRVRFSYVVDFLYFRLIDFPIFNVADCYVTAAAVLLVFLLLFYYKEEDFGFLSFRKKEPKADE